MSIVLARIDDRLIHGQVMTSWLNYTGANRIIIVDDETANDTFLKMIVTSVAPANIKTEVFSVHEGAETIKQLAASDKVILLAKSRYRIGESKHWRYGCKRRQNKIL